MRSYTEKTKTSDWVNLWIAGEIDRNFTGKLSEQLKLQCALVTPLSVSTIVV